MKYLIVNADDYGISPGVSRGILEAHLRGVLTSTSLMTETAASTSAAQRLVEAPNLSVGLHADLPRDLAQAADAEARARDLLERQIDRFRALVGREPSHLDAHHNLHRDPRLAPAFVAVALRHGLPLREHSIVRYFSRFYGQWGGRSHFEHIGPASLAAMLETEVKEGFTELSCHPGYPDLDSSYNREREVELRTLCDPQIPAVLERLGITRISYRDLPALAPSRVSPGEGA
jgi:chitin disaccharide deacetylase